MIANETITEAPKDCDDSGTLWESGKKIFHYLKTRNIRGETGQVAFDDNGDRIYAEYDVINMRINQGKHIVGSFYYDAVCTLLDTVEENYYKHFYFFVYYEFKEKQKMRLRINDSLILWPGEQVKKPEGIIIPTHLKVLTIEEKPFVYVRRLTDEDLNCDIDEIPCPHFNASDGTGKHIILSKIFNYFLILIFCCS